MTDIEYEGKDILESRKFRLSNTYYQHNDTTVMRHSINVAANSISIAKKIEWIGFCIDRKALVRGALLHDYFGYDYHDANAAGNIHPHLHGFFHPAIAAANARRDFEVTKREYTIIKRHMWPLTIVPPVSIEGWIVCIADKYCAVREGIEPFSWVRTLTGRHHIRLNRETK